MTALAAPVSLAAPAPDGLTAKQKAAVIVRFLMNEGAEVPLDRLSHDHQSELTAALSSMRYIDRETLARVLSEFANEIEGMGLTFPQGLAEALTALDGHISPQTASRLRKEAGVRQLGDPWEMIRSRPLEKLVPLLERESTEVAAVVLSKLPVAKAAELLSKLPGPEARRISYAISLTAAVTPAAVDRIGLSLAAQFEREPPRAFDGGPAQRLGAILNVSASTTREMLLDEIEEDDAEFGQELRKTIFTFADIPARLDPLDIPKLTRVVNPDDLLNALAFASRSKDAALQTAARFVLDNMSKRMAENLTEAVEMKSKISRRHGEEAMGKVIAVVFDLQSTGELTFKTEDNEEDAEGEG